MLPGTQNTAIVIVLVLLLFSIIILTVICGEYIFNFESRRLRTEGWIHLNVTFAIGQQIFPKTLYRTKKIARIANAVQIFVFDYLHRLKHQ